MVELILTALAAIAAVIALAWTLGASEPLFAIARGEAAWFVALKRPRASPLGLMPGVAVAWSSRADFAFVGADEPYWTDFFVLTGPAMDTPPLMLADTNEDAFVARVSLLRPPKLVLGVLKLLTASGVLSRPRGPVIRDASALGHTAAFMPDTAAIAGLTTRPSNYAPAMVNFLAYKGEAGARAYMRYGRVAMRTVYRTGGHLLFYGRIKEVLVAAKAGPTAGVWDDVAAMHYNRPEGILSMEHAPDYRAALHHRDEGLARTVVIASTPGAAE